MTVALAIQRHRLPPNKDIDSLLI
ncbi:hypothetical protein [Lactobacillus helveticus]